MGSMLETALKLIDNGMYLFPLQAGKKIPIPYVSWPKQSTNDKEQIEKWIDQGFNLGVDCGKSKLVVIDVDTKKDKNGYESLAQLQAMYDDLPENTLRVTTRSGGLHIYLRSDANIKNSAGRIGRGVDIRAAGGYVVAPGSEVEGGHYTINNTNFVMGELPFPWEQPLTAKNDTARGDPDNPFYDDSEENLKLCEAFLKDCDPAIEGDGGNEHTYKLALQLKDRGLSPHMSAVALLGEWNERCEPSWSPEELERICYNAHKYGKNQVGVSNPKNEFEPIPPTVNEGRRKNPYPFDLTNRQIKPRPFVYGEIALKGKFSLVVAPPGVGKSTFTIQMALAKATGKNLTGHDPRGQGPVWMYNNEDDLEELWRRIRAVMDYFDIKPEELLRKDPETGEKKLMLYVNSGENGRLNIAKRAGPNNELVPDGIEQIIDDIKVDNIEMFIIDPLSEMSEALENDNREMLRFMTMIRDIAQQGDTSIVGVHHDRKPENGKSDSSIGNMYSARGASSIIGAARVVQTLHVMTEKNARDFGIPKDDRFNYVRLDTAKANLSKSHGKPFWYERVEQRLNFIEGDPDSGEGVGVLKPIEMAESNVKVSDKRQELLDDIESILIEKRSHSDSLTNIVNLLVSDFPMHSKEKPATLRRAIRRLLGENQVDCEEGSLAIVELGSGRGATGKCVGVQWQEFSE